MNNQEMNAHEALEMTIEEPEDDAVKGVLIANDAKQSIKRTVGKWRTTLVCAAIMAVVTAFSLIDEFKWDVVFSLNFAVTFMYFVVLLTMYYKSTGSRGIDAGKQSEEWIGADAAYRQSINAAYDTQNIDLLDDYCESYKAIYIEKERRRILRRKMKYEEYCAGQYWEMTDEQVKNLKLSRVKKALILCANHVKPLALSSDVLLDLEDSSRFKREHFRSVEASRKFRFWTSMGPTILSSFLTAVPIVDMLIDLSYKSILTCMIRIAILLYTGYKGFRDNVLVYAVDGVKFRGWQTKHLRMFICWQKKVAPAPKSSQTSGNSMNNDE